MPLIDEQSVCRVSTAQSETARVRESQRGASGDCTHTVLRTLCCTERERETSERETSERETERDRQTRLHALQLSAKDQQEYRKMWWRMSSAVASSALRLLLLLFLGMQGAQWMSQAPAVCDAYTQSFRVVTTEVPPFSYDGDGQQTGYSIEFFTAMLPALEVELGFDDLNVTLDIRNSTSAMVAAVAELDSVAIADMDNHTEIVIGVGATTLTLSRSEQVRFLPASYFTGLQLVALQTDNFWATVLDIIESFVVVVLLFAVFIIVLVFVLGSIAFVCEMTWPRPGLTPIFMLFTEEEGVMRTLREIGLALKWAALAVSGSAVGKPASKGASVVRGILGAAQSALFIVATATLTALVTTSESSSTIASYEDLKGLTLCCVTGTTSCQYATENNIGFDIHEVDNTRSLVELLYRDKQCDAGLQDAPIMAYYVDLLADDYPDEVLLFIGTELTSDYYASFVNYSLPDTEFDALNSATVEVVNSKQVDELESTFIPVVPISGTEDGETGTSGSGDVRTSKIVTVFTAPLLIGLAVLVVFTCALQYTNAARIQKQRHIYLRNMIDKMESQNWVRQLRELSAREPDFLFESTDDTVSSVAAEVRSIHKLNLRMMSDMVAISASLGSSKGFRGNATSLAARLGHAPSVGSVVALPHDRDRDRDPSAAAADADGRGGSGGSPSVKDPSSRVVYSRPGKNMTNASQPEEPATLYSENTTAAVVGHEQGGMDLRGPRPPSGGVPSKDASSLFTNLDTAPKPSGTGVSVAASRQQQRSEEELREGASARLWAPQAPIRAGAESFLNLREWAATSVDADDVSALAAKFVFCAQQAFRAGTALNEVQFEAMEDVYAQVRDALPRAILAQQAMDEGAFIDMWLDFMRALRENNAAMDIVGQDITCTPVIARRGGVRYWWLVMEGRDVPATMQQQILPGRWTMCFQTFARPLTGSAMEDLRRSEATDSHSERHSATHRSSAPQAWWATRLFRRGQTDGTREPNPTRAPGGGLGMLSVGRDTELADRHTDGGTVGDNRNSLDEFSDLPTRKEAKSPGSAPECKTS